MIYYSFLVQRPIDRVPWPCIYEDLERAHAAVGRCSAVVQVELLVEEKLQPQKEDSTI